MVPTTVMLTRAECIPTKVYLIHKFNQRLYMVDKVICQLLRNWRDVDHVDLDIVGNVQQLTNYLIDHIWPLFSLQNKTDPNTV